MTRREGRGPRPSRAGRTGIERCTYRGCTLADALRAKLCYCLDLEARGSGESGRARCAPRRCRLLTSSRPASSTRTRPDSHRAFARGRELQGEIRALHQRIGEHQATRRSEMPSRRSVLSLTAALMSLLCDAVWGTGLAFAQAPPAEEPKP